MQLSLTQINPAPQVVPFPSGGYWQLPFTSGPGRGTGAGRGSHSPVSMQAHVRGYTVAVREIAPIFAARAGRLRT